MRKLLLILLLSTITSCLNTEDLNLDKFNEFVIEPEILLPFVQIDFSDKLYKEIYDNQNLTEKVIDMTDIDVFEELKLSENVDRIIFKFTAINGFPIKFDKISIIFKNKGGGDLVNMELDNIGAASLKPDNSLETPTKNDSLQFCFGPSSVEKIESTRSVRVIISWKGNTKPYPPNDDSFYFKLNSDLILKTKIDVGK
jgi:hypothetical protein